MVFEVTRSFGVKRFYFSRRNFREGKIVIAFVHIIRHPAAIMEVIRNTPVLENSRKIRTLLSAMEPEGDANVQ